MGEQREGANQRNSLGQLVEEVLEQLRSGTEVDIHDYTQRYPELASQVRAVFPVLMAMEGVADVSETQTILPGVNDSIEPPPALVGDYRIVREIGRGGMGVVFEAIQERLGRKVALKLVPGGVSLRGNHQQLRNEAQRLAKVEHPNIVSVYEVGEYQGRPYFSMQLVDGMSLASRIDHQPISPRAAAELLRPVCSAIATAHQCGIVHRDLKPSNILLDTMSRPHVADFGLAMFFQVGSLTASGVVAGTPSYMSPEQATDAHVGPASDIYSLGAVLYEMLTGRPPFQAASPVETIMMVLEEDPLPPRALNSQSDRELEAIALKCLQKNPALRYRTAEELGNDLQAYLDDEPVSAGKQGIRDTITFFRRETRFGPTLETWGAAMMFQAFYMFIVYALTAAIKLGNYQTHWPYYGLWAGSYPFWHVGFRWLRQWRGATSLVERQLSHLWIGGAMITVSVLVLEGALRLPGLILSPLFAMVSCTQFLSMGTFLNRIFYVPALAYLATAFVMAAMVRVAMLRSDDHLIALAVLLLSIIHWFAFFPMGLYYHRRYQRQIRRQV